MYTVEFDIKVLTPLYMFGANQNNPELRASEFKGMIRFWWRALKCCESIGELKEKEEKFFGGTSGEGYKSKIDIMIKNGREGKSNGNALVGNDLVKDYGFSNWHFNSKKRILEGKNRGIGYLFYSMLHKPKRYFKPDMTFKIILYSKKEDALKNAVAALWCAINLGGFGSRARRGAGSLSVVNIVGDTYGLDFVPKGKNSQELAQWIIENVNKAADIIKPVNADCDAYTNIISSSFVISKQGYNTWYEALSSIGEIYMDFRYKTRSDIQNSIFGFPVVHSNKNKVIGRIDKSGNYISRRSSPLSFKIVECDGRYHWMALKFGGAFLPQGADLVLLKSEKINGKEKKTVLKAEKPRSDLLDKFWDEIKQDNGGDYLFNLRGDTL